MATAKIIELDETNTCKICDNALAKYSCPKCNILYCSLDCYRSVTHLECSESFYKDNVLEELQMGGDSAENKQKMLEILQRVHENNKMSYSDDNDDSNWEEIDSDDDDDDNFYDPNFIDLTDDISDRLAGVDLDDAEQVWDKLTEEEKRDFVTFLKSEDVAKLIPSWDPWWLYHKNEKVEDIEKSEEYKKKCPELPSIKPFSQITKKQPSECVRYNLINIIASYAFTTRYFNGEHFDFASEAATCAVSLSLTLKSAQNFDDLETAVKSVEQECLLSDWIISDEDNMRTMREDLEKILEGPSESEKNFYILCALSDLHNLLMKSFEPDQEKVGEFHKKFPNEHFPTLKLESPEKLKGVLKKLDYYLSYAKDYYGCEL